MVVTSNAMYNIIIYTYTMVVTVVVGGVGQLQCGGGAIGTYMWHCLCNTRTHYCQAEGK